MKYLILLLLLSAKTAFGQIQLEDFEIRGKISGSIPLTYFKLAIKFKSAGGLLLDSDSIPIVNNEFKIAGKIAYPHALHLFYDDADLYLSSKIFFMDKGIQYLHINTDSIDNITPHLVGSKTHEIYIKYFLSDELEQMKLSINNFAYNVSVTDLSKSLYSKMSKLYFEERDIFLKKSAQEYNETIIPAWLMLDYMHRSGISNQYWDVYNSLSTDYQNTELGKHLYSEIKNASLVSIGGDFPKLNLKDINLNEFHDKLADSSKSFTLIDFWFGKCAPCIAQFESMKEIYANYANKNFEIVAISIDKEKELPIWREVIKKHDLPWIQYLDMGGVEARRLSVNAYPTNFLLDKSGKIIAKNIELDALKDLLERGSNEN